MDGRDYVLGSEVAAPSVVDLEELLRVLNDASNVERKLHAFIGQFPAVDLPHQLAITDQLLVFQIQELLHHRVASHLLAILEGLESSTRVRLVHDVQAESLVKVII